MTAPGMNGPRPTWPTGLKDDSPLPYALWRVMHHVNGRRTVEEIAQMAGIGVQDVAPVLSQVATWANRAALRSQHVSKAQAETVSQCLTTVLGPMGEFMVDDALDDLGNRTTLGALLSNLAAQLTEPQVQAFVRQLRAKGLA
ncbi:hypothetical protein [Deinococcus hopiensis]|uniref:DUF8082 domain-containing protein n=1 Tax=Deinococcus hopiensis KR-140 TaxID=695939 RepID=A0A1W1VDK9_9DEIO|nr:hypothetical protein [Deinococcus hopiensis]SMB91489.1 hypothetical protein SAMN00790413_01152 [Deinococcus hopiensis KR-140]